MDTQQKSHWEQGLALTLGLLLLASLTAYVGASTTPSSLFAQEDDDALIKKDDNEERRRQDEIRNFLNDFNNIKQEFKNNNVAREIKQQIKNLQRILKKVNKLTESKKTEFLDRVNKVMNELTALQQQIQTQRAQTEGQLKQYLAMTKKEVLQYLAKLEADDIQSTRQEMNDTMQDYRDATQEYYGDNPWETVNEIQQAVEGITRIPKELK